MVCKSDTSPIRIRHREQAKECDCQPNGAIEPAMSETTAPMDRQSPGRETAEQGAPTIGPDGKGGPRTPRSLPVDAPVVPFRYPGARPPEVALLADRESQPLRAGFPTPSTI